MDDTYSINEEILSIFPLNDSDKWIIICKRGDSQIGFIITRPILKSVKMFQEKLEHFSGFNNRLFADKAIMVPMPEIDINLFCNESDVVVVEGDNLIEEYSTVENKSIQELLQITLNKQKQNVT